MKTLTQAMERAVARTDGQGFRHVLHVDPDGDPTYLDCESRVIGAVKYKGELITVDPIDESAYGTDDLSIEVLDTPQNRAAIDLAVEVKLYLWAVGTASSDMDLKLWGEVSDPIEYGGGRIRFDVISRQAQQWSQTICRPLSEDDYPGADPDEFGAYMPVLYGSHVDHKCMAIDAGSLTTLIDDVIDFALAPGRGYDVCVTNGATYPETGVIQIDNEQMRYIEVGQVERFGIVVWRFRVIERGYNDTLVVGHDKGAIVAEVQTAYDYLVANHPVKKIDNIKVDGVLQKGDDFEVLLSENGVSKIRFNTRPLISKSVTIEVEDSTAISADQSQHTHASTAASQMEQMTLYTGYSLRCSSATFGINKSNIIHFDAPPGGAFDGFTTVGIATNNAVHWGIGYVQGLSPNSCFYSARQRIILAEGWGSNANVNVNYWGNQLRVFNLNDSDMFDIILLSATRRIYYATNMSSIAPQIDVTRTGEISLSGNSVSETVIGKVITCNADGFADDSSGSFTGVANDLINKPHHIIRHILKTFGKATAAEIKTTDFPVQTGIQAVKINSNATVRDIITSVADQARSIATYTGGRWRMAVLSKTLPIKPAPANADHTITDANVKRLEDRASSVAESRAGLRSLVNRLVWRAGQYADGSWYKTGVENDLESQAKYGVRESTIDLPYMFDRLGIFGIYALVGYLLIKNADPKLKIITLEATNELYALEVGDFVRFNSAKHGIDLYFDCTGIRSKGLTSSIITLEQQANFNWE